MSVRKAWLQRQYWTDVVAVLPEETVASRIELSSGVRASRPAHIDCPYGKHDRQQVDVFLPEGSGSWPLLVYVHGGYWQRGSKNDCAYLATAWNERGVAVATIGYRLLLDTTLANIVADVGSALRLLQENRDTFAIDTHRVVLSGLSAGAHLAAMQLTSACAIEPVAAVLLSGVYDPRPVKSTTPGALLTESLRAEMTDISPLGKPVRGGCRCLVAWGELETEVFHSQSQTLASSWVNFGTPAETVMIPGMNHFTVVDSLQGDADGPVSDFVSRHLLESGR